MFIVRACATVPAVTRGKGHRERRSALSRYIVIAVLVACLLVGSSASADEKKTTDDAKNKVELIREQWLASPHAASMDTPKERESMNKTGCAHCHTAQGYWEVILAGKESTAPYEDPTGITCIACHLQVEGSPEPGALRVDDVKDACVGCHDILVTNDEKKFSTCPQGSIFLGTGGERYADRNYPSGTHSKLKTGCVACHMAPDGAVGGHTARVISKGEDERVFNKNGCKMCHGALKLEFVEKSQKEVKALLEELSALLPGKPIDPEHPGEMEPKVPKDPSLSDVEAKAAFNYYVVVLDGTYGVHNPPYTKALLRESIQALKDEAGDR